MTLYNGKLEDDIETTKSALIVNGNPIRITSERDPSNINWGELDIDVVAECTGIFTTMEKGSSSY